MDLYYLASLQVLKVNLPLLGFIVCLIQLGLKVGYLRFCELLKCGHNFLYTGHFFSHSIVRLSSVLDRLLLECVHLVDLLTQGRFQELLTSVYILGDGRHLLY